MHKVRIERILKAQSETGRTIHQLLLTLIGLGGLSCLSLGFPDSFLLTSAATVNIPFAGPASFGTALVLLPILLIGLRIYLQIYIDHWKRLEQISRQFSQSREPTLSPLRHPALSLFTTFVLYALVPLVLGVLTYKAMVFSRWGPAMLALCVTVVLAQCVYSRLNWRRTAFLSFSVLLIAAIPWFFGTFDQFRRPFQLQLANFERADLEGQDLAGANLVRANLRQTNSKFVDLRNANLWSADFAGSNLKGTRFEFARLGVADFGKANAKCARFDSAVLQRVNFQGADLKGVGFRGSSLFEADLRNAKLSNADFSDADITRVDFTGATFCCTRMPNGEFNDRDCQRTGMKPESGCDPVQYCRSLLPSALGGQE